MKPPATRVPVRQTPEKTIRLLRAEAMLSSSPDRHTYAAGRDEVRNMGIDPDQLPHVKPSDEPESKVDS